MFNVHVTQIMAEFIHSTESEITGPFLIDRTQLESLDRLLNEEWSRFESERLKELDEAIDKTFKAEREYSWNKEHNDDKLRDLIKAKLSNSRDFRTDRQCVITLKEGYSVKETDIATALRDADLQDKEPTGFVVAFENGGRACKVTLRKRFQNSLSIEVSPSRDPLVQQTLTVLKNWQNSVRPAVWQSIWEKSMSIFFPWFAWLFAVLIIGATTAIQFDKTARHEQREEAVQLMTNGLSADKQTKAIELLLANAYDYHPTQPSHRFPNWYWFLVFGGFVYCIALTIKPSVAVAIGKGERKVRAWRIYSKFILITTPTFIFVTFMWPRVEAFIKSFF